MKVLGQEREVAVLPLCVQKMGRLPCFHFSSFITSALAALLYKEEIE